MKDFLRSWILPPKVWSLFKYLFSSKSFQVDNDIVQNAELKDKYNQIRRCFILATGPSINEESLQLLKGEFCISVSNFFVHPLYNELKPKFHVFAPLHPPIKQNQYLEWINDAINKTSFNNTFVMSNSDKEFLDINISSSQSKLYYNTGGTFPVDFSKRLPPIQTVVHIAIYLAIYMGINEIYLLGVDHSWVLHYGESKHFYAENEHKLVQQNYSEWIEEDIGKEFKNNAILWDIYRDIRNYCKTINVNIVNLTKGSLLDIYEKNNLENII